ncbi:MAG: carbohydrate-binding protein, partial [Clostridia bacterium]|nr:carbohydrate-binding protein [Clostridia bacterium]
KRKIESEDVFAVCLGKNDWVKYGVDVPQNGTYSIAARVSTSSGGAKLKINIGNSELVCTVPATATADGETVKVSLGRIALAGGLQAMRVEALSGSAEFVSFETYENAGDNAAVDFADFTLFGNATAGETL